MTHSNIKEKFLIEYDKASIASSYPSLTDYEIATVLDKAYLALIAQKLTGNNPRGVQFEGDTKAIEDIRPLITRITILPSDVDKEASNEYVYDLPEDFMYYLQSKANLTYRPNAIDEKTHSLVEVNLVTHELASKFMCTTHNFPWVEIPVCCLEDNILRMFIDPMRVDDNEEPSLNLMYIRKPNKFCGEYFSSNEFLWNDTEFELSDTMAEELVNLAVLMSTKIVESTRLTAEIQTRPLES